MDLLFESYILATLVTFVPTTQQYYSAMTNEFYSRLTPMNKSSIIERIIESYIKCPTVSDSNISENPAYLSISLIKHKQMFNVVSEELLDLITVNVLNICFSSYRRSILTPIFCDPSYLEYSNESTSFLKNLGTHESIYRNVLRELCDKHRSVGPNQSKDYFT